MDQHFHIASTNWSDLPERGVAVFLSLIRHCIYNVIITSLCTPDKCEVTSGQQERQRWFVLCKFGLFLKKITSSAQIEQCLSDNVLNVLLQ